MLKSTTSPWLPCGSCAHECGPACPCYCHVTDLVMVCAWCPPARRLAPPKHALVSHGLCDDCARTLNHQITTLEDLRRRQSAQALEIRH